MFLYCICCLRTERCKIADASAMRITRDAHNSAMSAMRGGHEVSSGDRGRSHWATFHPCSLEFAETNKTGHIAETHWRNRNNEIEKVPCWKLTCFKRSRLVDAQTDILRHSVLTHISISPYWWKLAEHLPWSNWCINLIPIVLKPWKCGFGPSHSLNFGGTSQLTL
jgi:hypothetical protein